MRSRWREHARYVIEETLREHAGESREEIRRALREAYPFGEREYHPYRIWLDEQRRALENLEPDFSDLPLFQQERTKQ